MNGWTGTAQWNVLNGMLVSNGSGGYDFPDATPPYQPTVANYAVEARIQIVNIGCCTAGFGLYARAITMDSGSDGYIGGVDNISAQRPFSGIADIHTGGDAPCCSNVLGSVNYTPDTGWHVYRLEVKGNHIAFLIDGHTVTQATDNQFLSSGAVGIECWNGLQIAVSSFKVIAL
jgi:hypothetical protein